MSIWSIGYLALLVADVYLYRRDAGRYRWISALLSILGIFGMVFARRLLSQALAEEQEFFGAYFPGVAQRLQQRFDLFAVVSIAAILLFFLLLPNLRKALPPFFLPRSGRAVVWAGLLLLLYSSVCSFYSISKVFDLASYLSAFTLSALLLLHLPLAVEKGSPAADASER